MSTDQPPPDRDDPGSGPGGDQDPFRPPPDDPRHRPTGPPQPPGPGGDRPPGWSGEQPPPGDWPASDAGGRPAGPPPLVDQAPSGGWPGDTGQGPPGGGPPPGGPPPPGAGGQPYPPYGAGPGYGEPDDAATRGMPPLGGPLRRLVARIIDALVVGVPMSVLMWAVGWWQWNDTWDNGDSGDAAYGGNYGGTLVTVLVYLVYEAVMYTRRGQTLGKMAMGLRVAMLSNGAVPTPQAAWSRASVYSLPNLVPCCGSVFWLVNVAWLLWDRPYRQCLHDKVAKTVVVSTR